MKIKMPLRAIVALILTVCIVSSVLTAYLLRDTYSAIPLSLANKLNKIKSIVDEEYYFEVNEGSQEEAVVNGYVSGLGDKYAAYYDKSNAGAVADKYKGNSSGIGILSVNNPRGEIYAWRVYSGSSADNAGLKSGDTVVKINGKSVSAMGYSKATELLRGKKGTKLTLTYKRGDSTYKATVTCGKYETQSVYAYLLNDKIGLIQVISFNAKTYLQFKTAVEELKKQGAESFIIDLRHNGGGTVDAAAKMVDYLLPECDTIHVKDKNGKVTVRNRSKKSHISEPIVILTDNKTASSSEIFTAAMQDFKRATVIGTKTFGKSLIQRTYSLGDGSVVKFTIGEFVRKDGSGYNESGLIPDIEVNPEYEGDYGYYFSDLTSDNLVKEAIRQLS